MPSFDFKKLEERVSSASSLDAAWTALSEAPEDFKKGRATSIATSATAFAIASRFADCDPARQENLTAALLWSAQVGLSSSADQDPETRYEIQQTREKVGNWLRGLPWEFRRQITPKVISLAVSALSRDNWKQACWLLSSVGWRNSQAVKALWDGSRDDATNRGDLLFCTLVDLGVPRHKRLRYLTEAHKRYSARKNRPNIHSVYILADVSSFPVLQNDIPEGNQTDDDKMAWIFLPQTIAHIADRINTEKAGSQAIRILSSLFTSHDAEMRHGIYLGGAVISKCNSRNAVRFLLELVLQELNAESQHNLMLLVRRLEECVAPNQVRALEISRDRTKLQTIFTSVLTKNNDYKGRNLTFDADVKNHLWNLCLTLGTENASKLGCDFIEADQNPYAQFKVLEDLACLVLDPLPSLIIQWARERAKPQADNRGTDEIHRMESIRVVTSAGTLEAFDVLLHSQFTLLLGQTLAASADGLAYLAVTVARQGQHRGYVVEELFKVLDQGPTGPQPGAVCSAIMDLAYVGLLEGSHYQRIIGYLVAEPSWTEPSVVKSRLISALSLAPATMLTEDFITKLEAWANLPDRFLSTSAFETLIKQGLYPGRTSSLDTKLNFVRDGTVLNLQPRDPNDVNGGIYASLAYRFPEKYEAGFASFLQGCAFGSLVEAMETFRRLLMKEPSSVLFSAKWAEALIHRAIQNNTRYNSEAHIFVFLEMYAPALLAATSWSGVFNNWTPETREALAKSLGTVPADSEPSDQATQTLTDLQNDAYFGVRRAAFRSLGRVRPKHLAAMVDSLAASPSPENRKLATEALYWIPAGQQVGFRWLSLIRKLREDVAEDVRESLWTSLQRARKIKWARLYQKELLSSTPDSNEAVLKRWKFAEAISHVGDDETATELSSFLRSNNLPANFQRFLIRTIERLEKNWEKCRQKWLEPFAPGNATTKTGSGLVTINGLNVPLQYLVWQRLDLLQPEILSWGGTGKTTEHLNQDLMGQQLVFTDVDGQAWNIWIHSITFPSTFSFVGGDRLSGNAD